MSHRRKADETLAETVCCLYGRHVHPSDEGIAAVVPGEDDVRGRADLVEKAHSRAETTTGDVVRQASEELALLAKK